MTDKPVSHEEARELSEARRRPYEQECATCRGTGDDPESRRMAAHERDLRDCRDCGGSGSVLKRDAPLSQWRHSQNCFRKRECECTCGAYEQNRAVRHAYDKGLAERESAERELAEKLRVAEAELEALRADLSLENNLYEQTKASLAAALGLAEQARREEYERGRAERTRPKCPHRNTVPTSAGEFCADCGAEL